MKKPTKLSVRMFLLLLLCVVMPLAGVCIYVRVSMEHFIQEKLSEKVIQNISRGERNICDNLQNIAALTNVFVYDEELQKRITDPNTSEYDNTKYFDQMIHKLSIASGFDFVQDMKIILFDGYSRFYSNWSMNYQDYQFLMDQDWVKKSKENNGHIVWAMFNPAYIIGEKKDQTYISLAKSLLNDYTTGNVIGTLIISIDQKKFSDLLMEYAYAGDMAYVCVGEGTVLLQNDTQGLIHEEDLRHLYRETEKKKSGKDMFEAAGIPIPTEWTFDEFREISKKLTHGEGQDKVYGMFWNSQQDLTYLFTYLVAQTNGGDPMYKNDKETNFDNPVVLKSVELINNMMNVDKTSPTHTDSVTQKLSQESMFLTGKSAMTVGPWIVRSVKDQASYPHDFKTAFAPYPVADSGQRNYTQGGYGDHLCINPKSQNIDAAWEFAKWYATEGMLPVVEGGRVPASNTYNALEVTEAFVMGAEDYLDADTTQKILIAPADNYAVPSITNHIAEVRKIAVEELEGIFIGKQTPEDGMKKAKARADELLQK